MPGGKRYALNTIVTLAVAARLAGYRGVNAFAQFAALLSQEQLKHETVDKGHGRIERRRCAVVDLSAAEWDGYANLHGRRQAMRIERERETLKTGKRSIEVT